MEHLRLKELRRAKKLTQLDVAAHLELDRTTIAKYENGQSSPDDETLVKLANFFNVSTDYLLGNETKATFDKKSNIVLLEEHNIFMIPIYESVSAGFGTSANDEIIDQTPLYFTSQTEAKETICIKVKGDSMYPKIEDGDLVQVHKQDSVDSGCVAVILLDGEEGLIKKIVYDKKHIELQSINPMYPPMIFEKEEMSKIQIVGVVRKIIKDM